MNNAKLCSDQKTKSYLGVDIGSTGVKLVELRDAGGVVELATYALAEYAVGKGPARVPESIDEVAATIKSAYEQANAVSRRAYGALPNHEIFASIISLPKLPNKEFQEAIKREAAKVLPLPLSEMRLDAPQIETNSSDGSQKVLLIGAPNTLVDHFDKTFKKSGLELIGLETEGFALIRALVGKDKAAVAVIDMGGSTSDIIVVDGTIPYLNRSIDMGGFAVTQSFARSLGVTETEAEQMKRDVGMYAPGRQVDKLPAPIRETVAPVLNEIKYTLNVFTEQTGKKVEKVILSGGAAMMGGLPQYLGEVLGVRVYVGDPWARVRYPVELKGILQEQAARFAVAVGLAMRSLK